jgi:hypothetical protein
VTAESPRELPGEAGLDKKGAIVRANCSGGNVLAKVPSSPDAASSLSRNILPLALCLWFANWWLP